ncbi:MAG: HAD family hydrolase [Treponema sp.]|nr:HAD family hydrolase [Treponema sp.]
MKVYFLPENIKALAFDMDLTLYTHSVYGQFQVDSLIERLGKKRGLSFDEMNEEVRLIRKRYAESSGGKVMSLSDIIKSYGISIEENIRWREESYEPSDFLQEDPVLKETLEVLSRFFTIGVITNNPVLIARKTLKALGVENCFSVIVGLDTCKVSKPNEKPFLKFSELSLCPKENSVSIGDRYDIDLAIPLALGFGGILVDGVEDVYELPSVLIR